MHQPVCLPSDDVIFAFKLRRAALAAVIRQVHLALFMDSRLDAEAFKRISGAPRWGERSSLREADN